MTEIAALYSFCQLTMWREWQEPRWFCPFEGMRYDSLKSCELVLQNWRREYKAMGRLDLLIKWTCHPLPPGPGIPTS